MDDFKKKFDESLATQKQLIEKSRQMNSSPHRLSIEEYKARRIIKLEPSIQKRKEFLQDAAEEGAGPQPLTIEEYNQRRQRKSDEQQEPRKKTKRAGKRYQRDKRRMELRTLIALTTGKEKEKLIKELKEFEKLKYLKQKY